MKSPLSDAARRSLQEDVKRMTAEQRLAAYLAHCQLVAQLAGAGGAGQHLRPTGPGRWFGFPVRCMNLLSPAGQLSKHPENAA